MMKVSIGWKKLFFFSIDNWVKAFHSRWDKPESRRTTSLLSADCLSCLRRTLSCFVTWTLDCWVGHLAWINIACHRLTAAYQRKESQEMIACFFRWHFGSGSLRPRTRSNYQQPTQWNNKQHGNTWGFPVFIHSLTVFNECALAITANLLERAHTLVKVRRVNERTPRVSIND